MKERSLNWKKKKIFIRIITDIEMTKKKNGGLNNNKIMNIKKMKIARMMNLKIFKMFMKIVIKMRPII